MPKIWFDVNVADAVAIDVANDVLPVWGMEVYPFCFYQSKSLSHSEFKWFWHLMANETVNYIRIVLHVLCRNQ